MTDAKLIEAMKSCGTGKEACSRCPFENPDNPHWHPECLYRAVNAAADRIESLRAENAAYASDIEAGRLVRTETCTMSEDQDFDGSVWTCSKCDHVFGYSGEPPYECCPFCGKRIEQYIGYDDPENPDYEDIDDARAALGREDAHDPV